MATWQWLFDWPSDPRQRVGGMPRWGYANRHIMSGVALHKYRGRR